MTMGERIRYFIAEDDGAVSVSRRPRVTGGFPGSDCARPLVGSPVGRDNVGRDKLMDRLRSLIKPFMPFDDGARVERADAPDSLPALVRLLHS